MKTKTTKRMLATLLTLVLILGALPFTAPLEVQASPIPPVPPTPTGTITAPGIVGNGQVLRVYGPATITDGITVNPGGVLILDTNRTISGTVTVNAGGRFYMSDGAITGSSRGLRVSGANAHFIMTGGQIFGNSTSGAGGGVMSDDGGRFYMFGGIIRNNSAVGGGGGVVAINNGTMIMNGGIIENNTSPSQGGGGILVSGATSNLTMNNGIIRGNSATNNTGGGIAVTGGANFLMNNGHIYSNRAYHAGGGGGVRVNANMTMVNGIIEGNYALNGGGIGLSGTVNMQGGVIRNNHESPLGGITQSGGGVNVGGANGVFNMSGGTIENNHATNGGGIWVGATALFNASNGYITNNHATDFGGGIWVQNYERLTISNAVTFRNNTAGAGAFDHGAENNAPITFSTDPPHPDVGAQGGYIGRINWGSVSLQGSHALNNYDINYFGAPWTPPPGPTPPTIRKYLRLPYGTDMPYDFDGNSFSFDFNMELANFWPPASNVPEFGDINFPAGTLPLQATFTSSMTPTGTGEFRYVYVDIPIPITPVEDVWPRAGVYTFRITEVPNSSGLNNRPNYNVEYDTTVFYLTIHVGRPTGDMDDPLEIMAVYASIVCPTCTPTEECDDCICWISDKDQPAVTVFTNRFSRRPSELPLQIEKIVYGQMANPNAGFRFRVDFDLPTDTEFPHEIELSGTGYSRTSDNFIIPNTNVALTMGQLRRLANTDAHYNATTYTINITNEGGLTFSRYFYLRHGDVITFTNLPIGTDFEVTEFAAEGYDKIGNVTTGGILRTPNPTPVTIGNLVVGGEILVRDAYSTLPADSVANFVVVTNRNEGVPETGVFFGNAPFGLMVALGAGALAVTATAAIVHGKKKR